MNNIPQVNNPMIFDTKNADKAINTALIHTFMCCISNRNQTLQYLVDLAMLERHNHDIERHSLRL